MNGHSLTGPAEHEHGRGKWIESGEAEGGGKKKVDPLCSFFLSPFLWGDDVVSRLIHGRGFLGLGRV